MGTFLLEWGRLFFAPIQKLGGLLTMTKPLEIVVLVAFGLSLYAFVAAVIWYVIPIPVPWRVFSIVGLIVFWGSFTAGRAYEISQDFSITIGPLKIDEPMRVFYILIINGPVPIRMKCNVVQITGETGDDRRRGRSWEGHWRDQPANFNGDLEPFEQEEYGWLQVQPFQGGNPALCIYSRETTPWHQRIGAEHSLVSASLDVPLENQGTVAFDVVIDCKIPSKKRGKLYRRRFLIAPAPGSATGYRILSDTEIAKPSSYRVEPAST